MAAGKVERLYRSGRCEVLYATGTRKDVLPSGLQTVFFCNGDVKQTATSRRVVYYHAEAYTTHVSAALDAGLSCLSHSGWHSRRRPYSTAGSCSVG